VQARKIVDGCKNMGFYTGEISNVIMGCCKDLGWINMIIRMGKMEQRNSRRRSWRHGFFVIHSLVNRLNEKPATPWMYMMLLPGSAISL